MWQEVEYVHSNDNTKLVCEASKYKRIQKLLNLEKLMAVIILVQKTKSLRKTPLQPQMEK